MGKTLALWGWNICWKRGLPLLWDRLLSRPLWEPVACPARCVVLRKAMNKRTEPPWSLWPTGRERDI